MAVKAESHHRFSRALSLFGKRRDDVQQGSSDQAELQLANDNTGANDGPTAGSLPNSETSEEKKHLKERWSDLPRRIITYLGGLYPDGTPYKSGQRLLIGKKGEEEQVMDTFERPANRETVERMFEGRSGPQNYFEGGFGLGIMPIQDLREMARRGGCLVIAELNKQIFGDAKNLFEGAIKNIRQGQKFGLFPQIEIDLIAGEADDVLRQYLPENREGELDSSRLQILLLRGDAYEAIEAFPDEFFDGVSFDLHQLTEEERGIDNLLEEDVVHKKVKYGGNRTFFAPHKYNESGYLDERQSKIIRAVWGDNFTVYHATTFPPPDSSYATGPRSIFGIPICKKVKTA
ncbi:MAG: hypothetical protein M1524_00810 [Patescibacteria group bacterium]|nr:hypothetical protein [Patescibacteria group bacterium]